MTTKSEEIYDRLKKLRNHGLKNRDEIEFFGYNSRMDTIQAVVGRHVMENLISLTEIRRKNAMFYDNELEKLSDFIILPPRQASVKEVFHTYIIQVKSREKLMGYLNEQGVETKIHYPVPIHLQKPCRKFGYKKGDFPVCEEQTKRTITLPVHNYLTNEQIYCVVDLIKKFYNCA